MQPDHILDPRGEVILLVRNSNSPFAPWTDEGTIPEASGYSYGHRLDLLELSSNSSSPEETEQDDKEDKEEEDKEIRIQVSARHLTLGSPFFNSMLSNTWKEGKEFQANGRIELVIDGWDIEALLVVMHIIHAQLDKVPRSLDVELLAKVAAIADYYSVDAVKFFGRIWMPGCGSAQLVMTKDSRGLLLWVWASYYFKDARGFRDSTVHCLHQHKGPISSLGLPIPGAIIDTMNQRRNRELSFLVDRIYTVRERLAAMAEEQTALFCNEACNALKLGALLRAMRKVNLFYDKPQPPYPGLRYMDVWNMTCFYTPPGLIEKEKETGEYLMHECPRACAEDMIFEGGQMRGLSLEDFSENGLSGEDVIW
ncbi:hypothetical protein BJX61DRAFT_544042 [Aspergillus egyptiacus]|nr:hypothetical protein BJX61DRAFT_544042 [Aspergillus egyptiacus]